MLKIYPGHPGPTRVWNISKSAKGLPPKIYHDKIGVPELGPETIDFPNLSFLFDSWLF